MASNKSEGFGRGNTFATFVTAGAAAILPVVSFSSYAASGADRKFNDGLYCGALQDGGGAGGAITSCAKTLRVCRPMNIKIANAVFIFALSHFRG